MLRWFIVIFLALLFVGWLNPLLHKIGLGRLPGDLRFHLFGHDWNLPLASTLLLSLVATLVAKLV